jgi:hypothetical protein
MNVQRISALVIVMFFGAVSIGADDCGGFDSTTSYKPLDCCGPGTQHYTCTVQARVQEVVPTGDGNAISTQCYRAPASCWPSNLEAQNQAQALAVAALHDHMNTIVTPQTVTCSPLGRCIPQGTLAEPLVEPMTGDTCAVTIMTVPDAGDSTGNGSCSPDGAPCSLPDTCCGGYCNETSFACESCKTMLEGCTTDAECCSGMCSLNGCT